MAHSSTLFVGLDVHKESISVAHVSEGREAEVVFLGPMGDPAVWQRQADPQAAIEREDAALCGRSRSVWVLVVPTSPRRDCAAGSWLRRAFQRRPATESTTIT